MALNRRSYQNPPPTNPPGPKPHIITGPNDVTIHGDVKIRFPNGTSIRIAEIIERLEALERMYMEEKLLGKSE